MQGAGVRRRRRSGSVAAALVVTLALVATLAPPTTQPAGAAAPDVRPGGVRAPLATLEIESPAVRVKPAGKSRFVDAKDGRALKAGDTVRTSATGRAEISYADGSLTRLDVSTEYRLVKLSNAKGTRKTKGLQTAGQTWHRVESLSGSDTYKVEGAHATAAVLGTAFVVECATRDQCTFTAVVDPIRLRDASPRNGTKTVTLTPGDRAIVVDDAIGPVTTLTQEELLAIQWIVRNLLADQTAGLSPGLGEIAAQADPPPTRPPSSPVVQPPPPGPTVTTVTGGGTGAATGAPPGSTGGDPGPEPGPDPGNGGDPPIDPPTDPPPNRAPVASDDAYAMPEDTLLAIAAPGVLANDGDPDGDALELFLTGLPAHGSLTVFPDGAFVYFPDADFTGSDSFTYVAGDGEYGSNPATVRITVTPVNDPPVAASDVYTVDAATLLTVAAPGVLGNDRDVDGPSLTAVLVSPPSGSDTFTFLADGSFTFLPGEGVTGPVTFTYRAFDGTLSSNLATVTITVGVSNDAPEAVADVYTIDEDTALVVAAPGVLGNDSDPDGDPLTVIWPPAAGILAPEHGTLTPGSDGAFVYTPFANFHGSDFFTYRVTDGSMESAATVLITVEPIADAPEAADDDYEVDEDGILSIEAPGVLANDADPDDDALTAVLDDDVTHGTLDLEADGSFTYTPDHDFHGEDSFTYHASDGGLQSSNVTVTITVNAQNDPPTVIDHACSTVENQSLAADSCEGMSTLDVLVGSADVDDDPLTAVLDDGVDHGTLVLNSNGTFTYTPYPNFWGTDSFTYHANDGTADSNLATVTITVTNTFVPWTFAKIHHVASGETLFFTLDAYFGAAFGPRFFVIASPPVVQGEEPEPDLLWGFPGSYVTAETVPYVDSNGFLGFDAPDVDETTVYSFTWRAWNAFGASQTVTEYIVVETDVVDTTSTPPVVGDVFGETESGAPVTVTVPLNPDGIGNEVVSCTIASIGPWLGTVTVENETDTSFDVVFTPAGWIDAAIVRWHVNACISESQATDTEGGDGYVAVGDPEISAPYFDYYQDDDADGWLFNEVGVWFSVSAYDDNEVLGGSGLPLTIELVSTTHPDGTLRVLQGSNGYWEFEYWEPGFEEDTEVVLVLRVSNGFESVDQTFTIYYSNPV